MTTNQRDVHTLSMDVKLANIWALTDSNRANARFGNVQMGVGGQPNVGADDPYRILNQHYGGQGRSFRVGANEDALTAANVTIRNSARRFVARTEPLVADWVGDNSDRYTTWVLDQQQRQKFSEALNVDSAASKPKPSWQKPSTLSYIVDVMAWKVGRVFMHAWQDKAIGTQFLETQAAGKTQVGIFRIEVKLKISTLRMFGEVSENSTLRKHMRALKEGKSAKVSRYTRFQDFDNDAVRDRVPANERLRLAKLDLKKRLDVAIGQREALGRPPTPEQIREYAANPRLGTPLGNKIERYNRLTRELDGTEGNEDNDAVIGLRQGFTDANDQYEVHTTATNRMRVGVAQRDGQPVPQDAQAQRITDENDELSFIFLMFVQKAKPDERAKCWIMFLPVLDIEYQILVSAWVPLKNASPEDRVLDLATLARRVPNFVRDTETQMSLTKRLWRASPFLLREKEMTHYSRLVEYISEAEVDTPHQDQIVLHDQPLEGDKAPNVMHRSDVIMKLREELGHCNNTDSLKTVLDCLVKKKSQLIKCDANRIPGVNVDVRECDIPLPEFIRKLLPGMRSEDMDEYDYDGAVRLEAGEIPVEDRINVDMNKRTLARNVRMPTFFLKALQSIHKSKTDDSAKASGFVTVHALRWVLVICWRVFLAKKVFLRTNELYRDVAPTPWQLLVRLVYEWDPFPLGAEVDKMFTRFEDIIFAFDSDVLGKLSKWAFAEGDLDLSRQIDILRTKMMQLVADTNKNFPTRMFTAMIDDWQTPSMRRSQRAEMLEVIRQVGVAQAAGRRAGGGGDVAADAGIVPGGGGGGAPAVEMEDV